MNSFFLGIDLGGTEIKIAIVDQKGNICEESSVPNRIDSLPAMIVREIAGEARKMPHFKSICGVGVGVAGDIDQEKGVVRFSPNMTEWKQVPLRKMLEKEIKRPVVIDNDANAAAVGAYWLDAKGKVSNLVCVTLGTGVGGGVMLDGRIYRGATGSAGEIGHISLDADGPQCNCGSRGCIERYVGAPFLSQRAREIVKKDRNTAIAKIVQGNLDLITPKVLSLAAEEGDALAVRIWNEAGEMLGVVLAGVINLMNPEMIVLAGGVSRAGRFLLDPIQRTVKERAFTSASEACRIVISQSTKKLGVVGAAFLAK